MAGKSTISITFKLEGDNTGFKNLTKDAQGLKTALTSVLEKGQQINPKTINFAALTTGIQNTYFAIQNVTNQLQGFIDKANSATEAQTKLNVVMQQRMGATSQDVAAINQLVASQTKLGVVGGTVQKSGLQQLATFASQRSTLQTLLPAMNNLLVQQHGLTSTTQDAVAVANLMGKALQGNYSALKRVGITFSDAQAQLIKTGDEGTRAATIAEVITQNVGNMNAEMAKTDPGKVKQQQNAYAGLEVQIGKVIGPYQTLINIFGQIGFAVTGISQLVTALYGVAKATGLVTLAQKTGLVIGRMYATNLLAMSLRMGGLSTSAYIAAGAMTALKVAIRGILIATGVGIALAGVGMIIDGLSSSSDKATNALGQTTTAMDGLKSATEQAKNQIADQVAAYNLAIAKTKDFKGSKEKEKEVVDDLNSTYGNTLGVYSSVSQWYQVLTSNAQTYTRMLLAQAKMQILVNKAAKDQLDLEELERQEPDLRRHTVTTKGGKQIQLPSKNDLKGYDPNLSPSENEQINRIRNLRFTKGEDGKWQASDRRVRYNQLSQSIAQENAQIDQLQKEIAGYQKQFKSAPKPTGNNGGGGGKGGTTTTTRNNRGGGNNTTNQPKQLIQKNEMGLADYQNNSEYYQQEIAKLDANNPNDTEKIKKLQQAKKLVDDIIDKYNQLANAPEPPKADDALQTYDELDYAVQYYSDELRKALPEARPEIQAHIDKLTDIRKKWEDADKGVKEYHPEDISKLNTIEDLDKAIGYYQQQQNKQTADEITNTQKVINALEDKRKALQRGTDLLSQQKEIDEVNGLSDKDFKVRVRAIGFDGLTDKIKELQKLLNDTKNPLTADQRKQVEQMIGVYEQWRKKSVSAFDTVQQGWDGVKGIGGSISSITDALQNNSNAWEKVTAIIDGFIQLYESIRAIVGIIQMLTIASEAHTAAKMGEAAAETADATASGINTGMQTAAATSMIPVIVANKLATASYMELATAKYFAAHADIPFAGFGIASGFSAAAVAQTLAVSVMPFAKGGVVSGPTLALVGEYGGAKNNPEVIAPLDKLKNMIDAPGGGIIVNPRLEFNGHKMIIWLDQQRGIMGKSGRKFKNS